MSTFKEHRAKRCRPMENCCGRNGAFSSGPASSLGSSGIDNRRCRGRRVGRSRGRRSHPSPGSLVHPAQFRFTHRCHHSLHRDGYLCFCRNRILSEPGPHMASSFRRGCDPFVCALRLVGDFTHHGRRLARGFRSHDNARGSLGALCHALTLARDHQAPRQNATSRPSSLDPLA